VNELREILDENPYCTLASASLGGQPWVSPLFFNYDAATLRIVWESARESRHSCLIAENPLVSLVVSNVCTGGAPRGIYLECEAREVPPEGLTEALALFAQGPHKKEVNRSLNDYLGEKPLRLYEAIPQAAYVLRQVETAEGYVIDERLPLELR
jgi:uncharacterized protein YhbP (UPF0306 family)